MTNKLIKKNLQKCIFCNKEILLEEKNARYDQKLCHRNCLDLFMNKKVQPKRQASKNTTPNTKPYSIPKKGPDPVQIALACGVFIILSVTAYLMLSLVTVVVMILVGVLSIYQIVTFTRVKNSAFKHGKHLPSIFSLFMLILPLVIGTIITIDGYFQWESFFRLAILWGLSVTFWSVMLFVPMAIASKYMEDNIPDPKFLPMLSILVPAYNEEKVIARTIEALKEANYPKKEIIVIDDGSKDRTLEIVNFYKKDVKVLHKANGGKASALNYGLMFSKGEIIVVVDADTIIGRDALRHLAKAFSRHEKVAAVAGNIKVINRVNWLTKCQSLEYISGIQIARRAFDLFGAITIVPGALGAFKKSALEQIGTYHKDTLVEDFDATLKVLKSGQVVQGSTRAVAFTQAPTTLRDFYNQRKRWYRGNLQVFSRHSDAARNPRYGNLQKLAYPFMLLSNIVMPIVGVVVLVNVILAILYGDWFFVVQIMILFIVLQYLLTALAVRIDGDDPKLILYSIFLAFGYKHIMDFLLIKAIVETLLKSKASWTSAKRTKFETKANNV